MVVSLIVMCSATSAIDQRSGPALNVRMGTPSNSAFRALADHTRREILRLLRGGPRTSGEIAARFDSSWPTISRHLAVLRDAGLVVAERKGQEIYYELNKDAN
jgi:DNA-binding transcriptional ArsR family regulator